MVAQVVEASAISGKTAQLVVISDGAVVATAAATELSGDPKLKGKYRATFTDLPLATYQLVVWEPANSRVLSEWWVVISGGTGPFFAMEVPGGSGSIVADFTGNALTIMQGFMTNLIANLQVSTGTITGFPGTLRKGDSYTLYTNDHIVVYSRDENGAPLRVKGSAAFAAATVTGWLARQGRTEEIQLTVTWVDPVTSDPYWRIEIPYTETRKAVPHETYYGQLKLAWVTPTAARHTITGIETQFTEDLDGQQT